MEVENIQNENQCQHPGCKCGRPSTGDYCSTYCENEGTLGMDNSCACGHPECE